MQKMLVTFPGGKKVDAHFDGFHIQTDQPILAGGEGSAPEPYTLFLASIATCAGIYVKSFCDHRGIPADDITLTQRMHYDPTKRRMAKIDIEILVPEDFPEKYRKPLARAAGQCAVKRTMEDPPLFEVETLVASASAQRHRESDSASQPRA